MSKLNRLKEVIRHAYENAPAVRKRMDDAGVTPDDIQSVADLSKIPVITKDEMAKLQQGDPPFGGTLTVPLNSLRRIFISPGPLFEPEGTGQFEALQGEIVKSVGIGDDDIVINTFSYHLTPAGLVFDYECAASGATVVPTGPGNTEYQVNIMMGLGVSGYAGTPSFLKIILDKAEEMGIPREVIPIKKAVMAAEPYPPSLRNLFEQDYGMATCQTYATADVGVIGYDWPGQTTLKTTDHLVVEITDPVTGEAVPFGETGQVVVSNFNSIYPMLRLGTGDLSAAIGEPDEEGFNAYIKGWMGRVGDAIKVRGMFLHPLPLKKAVSQFESLGNVQAFVTRPDTRDHVRLSVELNDDSVDQTALADEVKSVVGETCRLRIDEVGFVASGSIDAADRTVVDERTWD
ncbi:MAG: phenylacetate--CoA ligase family protein [Chloroflexota bacterium]